MLRIWGNKFQLKEIIKANSRSLDDNAQSSNEQATIFLCPVDEPLCDMLSFTQRCATKSKCLSDRSDLCEPIDPSEGGISSDVRGCYYNLCTKANTPALPGPNSKPVKCYQYTGQPLPLLFPQELGWLWPVQKIVSVWKGRFMMAKETNYQLQCTAKDALLHCYVIRTSLDNCKFLDPAATPTMWDVGCFSSGLCNATKVPIVSAIPLLACGVVAVIR